MNFLRFACAVCLGIMVCAACPYIHTHVRAGERDFVHGARAWLAKHK